MFCYYQINFSIQVTVHVYLKKQVLKQNGFEWLCEGIKYRLTISTNKYIYIYNMYNLNNFNEIYLCIFRYIMAVKLLTPKKSVFKWFVYHVSARNLFNKLFSEWKNNIYLWLLSDNLTFPWTHKLLQNNCVCMY